MWSSAGSRNIGGLLQRTQPSGLSSQQGQQEDLFTPTSSRQGSFRFGTQGSMSQTTQAPPTTIDEFPPLNRNANGEIGQERGANLMTSLGFGSQGAPPSSTGQSSRGGNGLLNALSANVRASEARTPTSATIPGK
jgi:CCR4-NOT transcription complex subunit 2